MRPKAYQEHHFQNQEDVGVAWNHDRIWVCLNGQSLLRVKVMADGELMVEFTPPHGHDPAPSILSISEDQ